MRDDFLAKTKRELAHRVGFKCSNPECRKSTSGPSQVNNDSHINIGVAAHICAASKGGPRFNSSMSSTERMSPENGIWLCQSCSKLIDSDSTHYTIAVLHSWKKAAEDSASDELSTNYVSNIYKKDKELIQFYLQCFDRPAFQRTIYQEGEMEDFEQAINGTIIALNTGVLKTRDGSILKDKEGKSVITNDDWREKMNTIGDILFAIQDKIAVAKNKGWIHENGFYFFSDDSTAKDLDNLRLKILEILSSVCNEAGIKYKLVFPRERYC